MLTPQFQCKQTDEVIYVCIKVKHAKMSDVQIVVLENTFSFYLKPYLLRLTFSGQLVAAEDDNEKFTYDPQSEEITVELNKNNRGEHFTNLDMVTALLTPPDKLIEELTPQGTTPTCATAQPSTEGCTNRYYYGFNDSFCDIFNPLCDELSEIVDYGPESPDIMQSVDMETETNARISARIQQENEKFDVEHYAMDYVLEDMELAEVFAYKPFWLVLAKLKKQWRHKYKESEGGITKKEEPASLRNMLNIVSNDDTTEDQPTCQDEGVSLVPVNTKKRKAALIVELDDSGKPENSQSSPSVGSTETKGDISSLITWSTEEFDILKRLQGKNYLITNLDKVVYTLLDILLAYCYELRASQGDHNPEAGWTICKLSTSCSWLTTFEELKGVLIAFCRRALCFPLYRNWNLAVKCISDLKHLLFCGRTAMIRCLLNIRHILGKTEWKYIQNKIFVDPYIVWLQTTDVTDQYFSALSEQVGNQLKALCKQDIGIKLGDVEQWAEEHRHELREEDEEDESMQRGML